MPPHHYSCLYSTPMPVRQYSCLRCRPHASAALRPGCAAERGRHADSLAQLAASSSEAHSPTAAAAAAAAAAEAAKAQQGTQRELDCQLALNRTIHAQLKQADDLLARSEAGEMQLRNELADQAELLASTKRKLALLSQSQGQGQGQGGLQPLGRQGSLVKAPEGSAELQKVLDRRGEELELERANSILLQRCALDCVRMR